jgi:PAS domain S-box-containing protein
MQKPFQSKEAVYNLFMQAPVGIYLLKGPEYIIEMANEPILELWGKGPGVIGKPVLESFPEVKEQGFIELLDGVRTTGVPFQTDEIAVWYNYSGEKKQKYVTLLYQPFYEEGEVSGIFSIATDVTDKVLAKRALEKSEQNLRNIILQAPVAMCIFSGPEFVVEIANERMFAFWGKPGSAFLGKPIFEGLPEARNQGFEELLETVFHHGETITASEQPVTLPRGEGVEQVYVNFVYEPLRQEDGKITGVMAVAVEVTDQVVARKKIEESEQRVRAVVSSAPFPIGVYVGKDMQIALANQSLIDVWGKGADIIGKNYAEILPELAGTGIYDQLNKVLTTGKAIHARNQQVDIVHQGKLEPHYFNYSFTPLFDTEGEIYGVMNTAAEITDLILARQKVEQSERNLRNLVLQAPVAMCILLGKDHVIEIANEMMIGLWGKPREAVMHKPVFEALPDVREQGLEAVMEQVYQSGETFTAYESPIKLLRHGVWETVYQNFVYEPYRDAEGNILGVLVISIDVTQQVLARLKIEEVVAARTQELASSNEELKRSNANLEEFAYAASHDLKEPVRKIHFFADMLQHQLAGKLEVADKKVFERMQVAAKRMGTLIDELLVYSQVTKGMANVEEVDLNRKVQLVLEDLELEIQEKKASVTVEPLPSIRGNKRQIQQLFFNLLGNALKYSKEGVPPLIHIGYKLINADHLEHAVPPGKLSGTYHLIEVSDNGVGFEQKDAERIFQVFTRLFTGGAYRGTGIGLSIVRKVAENHGGWVWAESSPSKGARFKVVLPA